MARNYSHSLEAESGPLCHVNSQQGAQIHSHFSHKQLILPTNRMSLELAENSALDNILLEEDQWDTEAEDPARHPRNSDTGQFRDDKELCCFKHLFMC